MSNIRLKNLITEVFEDRELLFRRLRKQKVEEMFQFKDLNNHRSDAYNEWLELWDECYELIESCQWRKALTTLDIALEKMVDVKDLFPAPPDLFSEEKVSCIKQCKEEGFEKVQPVGTIFLIL